MNLKNLMMWGLIVLLVVGLFQLFQNPQKKSMVPEQTPFSEFLKNVDDGRVVQVEIKGNTIEGILSDGTAFNTYAPNDPNLVEKLTSKGVTITASPIEEKMPSLLGILLSWFPMLLLIGVWIFFMRQMQGGRGGAMGFGKSKAKLLSEARGKVTFNDVAGIDEAKEEVEEIIEFLKDPRKFRRLGGKIPKGALLIGPPGTGKTLLARAIAGEANVPFFTISGSDFVEMFVGVGASRVRDMMDQGKKNAPCIIFIDEIDAVGRSRGAGLGGGNDEREQTLNQLLVEMDGFDTNEGVIIIAATNRPDVLDPALLRPGRFDRQVVVPNPDIIGREAILKVHIKKINTGPDVKLRTIARGTPGFSGADLANLCNESALLAARKNKRIVTMSDVEEAKDKVMMGAERRSMVMTEDDKKLTAYHEGGHAIVALNEKASDPIHKATIIPRGRALGVVWTLPERDKYSHTREYLEANISKAMGGRVAEEMIFGHEKVTSGASSDIQVATKLAKDMVTKFGMSNELGPLSQQFSEHTIKRTYEALIWGYLKPQYGKIREKISRSTKNRQLMAVRKEKGKMAITNYKTLKIFQNSNLPKISLIECKLETGRTHQIRVHMNFKGNPIIGDKSYGKSKKKFRKIDPKIENEINNFNRQALHAKSLGFIHPKTKEEVFFEARRPDDFETLIKNLKKASV